MVTAAAPTVFDAFANVFGHLRGTGRAQDPAAPAPEVTYRQLVADLAAAREDALTLLRVGGVISQMHDRAEALAKAAAALSGHYWHHHPNPETGPVPIADVAANSQVRVFKEAYELAGRDGLGRKATPQMLMAFTYPRELL